MAEHRCLQTWVPLLGGLVFAGCVRAFLLVLAGRTARIEALATRVKKLEAEIAERDALEESSRQLNGQIGLQDQDATWAEEQIARRLSGKSESNHQKIRVKKKNGEIFHAELYDSSFVYQGRPATLGMVVDATERVMTERALRQYRDHLEDLVRERTETLTAVNERLASEIEERKTAEKLLRKSEERLSKFFHLSAVANSITRLSDGVFVDANETFLSLAGLTREELLGHTATELGFWRKPEDRAAVMETIRRQGRLHGIKHQFKKESGELVELLVSMEAIELDGELHTLSKAFDVTTQVEMERALHETKESFEALINATPEAIVVFDPAGKVRLWNPAAERLFGWAAEEVLGGPLPYVSSQQREEHDSFRSAALRGESGRRIEVRRTKKDGSPVDVSISWAPLRNVEGNISGIMGVVIDITRRKLADEALKASLREKEILLREIHHRVKNNMQVMSSLLALQVERTKDEQARSILIENQQRIFAMASVHDTIYCNGNLTSIDFSVYLKNLSRNLQDAYTGGADVRIALEVGEIALNVDQAATCGLIVNELITNSLKHAFPAGGKGMIQIKSYRSNENEVVLEVSDNGTGLPADLVPGMTSSLGLRLIHGLVTHQLKGRLDVRSEGGAAFTIRWPLPSVEGGNA